MKLTKLSVHRPIAMSMVIFLILVIGAVAFIGLDVDLFPSLEYPIVAVQINYPGTGPEEVENLITRPLENVLGTVSNVEEIRSTSRLGGTLINVEFDWGTNMDAAMTDIRERLQSIQDFLPEEASTPSVLQYGAQNLPLLQLAVSSSTHDITETKRIAENFIQPLLERTEGVASVNVEGGREKEILLTFNPGELHNYDLTLTSIRQMLQAENINLPGGVIVEQNREVPLRITGQFESIREIEDLLIPTGTGEIIPLSTLAQIEETYKPTTVITKLNTEPSVGITIQKQAGANTVAVGDEIHNTLRELEDDLPDGISTAPIFDQSLYIKQSIRAVGVNMLFGAGLAVLILFLFLRNLKSTFIVAVSIPISVISTFGFMFLAGQSLNLLTLGGLALGIGMMVDNAIVILENIFRYRTRGASLQEAAVQGTSEVGPAVIASTLTTVIVFLPLIFVEGLAAQLFRPLSLVVALSLLASLFTAIITVPLLFSRMVKVGPNTESPEKEYRPPQIFERVKNFYERLLRGSLKRPKKVCLGILALVLLSLACIPFIGTEFLPHLDESVLSMDIRLPVGSTLETTLRSTCDVEDKIADIPEIENVYVSLGGVGQFQVGAGSLAHRANYTLPLVPLGERSRSDHEIADEIRHRLSEVPGIQVNVNAGESGSSLAGTPVSLNIQGPNIEVLEALADDVTSVLENIEGVQGISSNVNRVQEEMQVTVDRFKAAQYGISTAHVADAIQQANRGVIATRLSREGEELDVRLTLGEKYQHQVDRLRLIEIQTERGVSVPLQQIAEFKKEVGPQTITRSNKAREIRVQSQLLDRDQGSAISEIRATLEKELTLPSGYRIHFGGQEEEKSDAFQKLTAALLLAVLLVYMLLAAQFESLFYPLIIMLAIPLAGIGVLLGLFITGRPLGVGAMVGLLVLAGIVVNNAIVFVDYVNTLRKQGMSREEALYTAGPIRLRPILMTTLTTILGLVPLMLGFGEGSEIQAPLATVVIFGLLFSTVITLIFVPVMYQLLDEWREKRHEKKTREA